MHRSDANKLKANRHNLRYVMTVLGEDSIAAASPSLTNRPAVPRRLARFQRRLGCCIFVSSDSDQAFMPEAAEVMFVAR